MGRFNSLTTGISQAQANAMYAAIAAGVPQVATIAALRLVSGSANNELRYLRGYSANGDGGEGLFRSDSSDTTTADDGVITIVDAAGMRWKRAADSPPKVTSLPTPSSLYRGRRLRIEGASLVADATYECAKQDNNAYVWAALGPEGHRERVMKPAAAIRTTIPREIITSGAGTITSGAMYLDAIALPAGLVITSISYVSSGALATGSNQWFGLYDSARAKLAVTSDDTSTAWAASSVKTLNLASPYTTTYSGLHYLAICVVATTPPTLVGNSTNNVVNNLTPRLAGFSNTALTTPSTAPATATNPTGATQHHFAYVA